MIVLINHDGKSEIYTFMVESKYFLLHPHSGVIFESDRKTYEFCNAVGTFGWGRGKEEFVKKYSESEWDALISEIKADETLNKIFFGEKPKPNPPLGIIKSKLSSLSLNVMEDCNFACVYCYGNTGTYNTPNVKMDFETGKKAIGLLIKEGKQVVNIGFFGGEPLLNFPLIQKLVAYAKEKTKDHNKTVNFSITTNGYLINDEVIDFFLENNFTVTLSFDGPKEIQDYNRPLRSGAGTFGVVSKNAKKMLEKGVKVSVRATILPSQLEGYYDIYRFFVDFGFKSVHLEVATINEKSTEEHIAIIKEALEKIAKDELRHYKEKGIIYTKLRDIVRSIYFTAVRPYPCGVARTYFGVSADGTIYPRHRFVGMCNFVIGSVDDFKWENEFIQKILHSTVDKRPYCKDCPIRMYCGGGCIYNNFYYNGDIFKPDKFHCAYMEELFKWGVWLYSNLDEDWLDKAFSRSPLHGVRDEAQADESKTKTNGGDAGDI